MPWSIRRQLFVQTRLHWLMGGVATVFVVGGLLMFAIEAPGGGNIRTIEDGLWWSITTLSGVGYGDRYPITTLGRILGGAQQMLGLISLGAIISFIGVDISRRLDDKNRALQTERQMEIDKRLESIERKIDFLVKDQHAK